MQHISGISRSQISFTSLEDFIPTHHEVRCIDAFVDSMNLIKLGFNVQTLKNEGRPSFQSPVFRNALADIALEAKKNLEIETYTALVDKGYHNGRQIQQCTDANISTIVAQQEIVNSNEKGTTPDYMVTKFVYNKEEDTYTCHQGQTHTTTGTWHTKKSEDTIHYRFKAYRTPKCKTCPVQDLCTDKADRRREIQRSEFAEAVEANNKRYKENPELYRKRQ